MTMTMLQQKVDRCRPASAIDRIGPTIMLPPHQSSRSSTMEQHFTGWQQRYRQEAARAPARTSETYDLPLSYRNE